MNVAKTTYSPADRCGYHNSQPCRQVWLTQQTTLLTDVADTSLHLMVTCNSRFVTHIHCCKTLTQYAVPDGDYSTAESFNTTSETTVS